MRVRAVIDVRRVIRRLMRTIQRLAVSRVGKPHLRRSVPVVHVGQKALTLNRYDAHRPQKRYRASWEKTGEH